MITPEEFPYIKSIHVKDCYAYQNFDINLVEYPGKPFSHLILTGKNGSGKSTILRSLDKILRNPPKSSRPNDNMLSLGLEWEIKQVLSSTSYVSTFLKADRQLIKPEKVTTVINDKDLIKTLEKKGSSETVIRLFKQYIVNKKVSQAFNQLNNEYSRLEQTGLFFEQITNALRKAFEYSKLELIFDQESFELYLTLHDGRQVTFEILSDGFTALINILMDLFIRVDIIRRNLDNFNSNPCGIVLIDEPETHLHLQLQEQVLPLLISLFPNIQFIAATHSPAVIASIKYATIFDLTTKESRTDEVVGRSYTELMTRHFGLNNEYSSIADEIFKKVKKALQDNKEKPGQLKNEIRRIVSENEAYISPTFLVDLEAMILENA